MGNELQKQYNIKTKPLKLPGAYNFLRFTYHPTQPQSIFIIKSPHKATLMQSSTLILPIYEIKNLSSSSDSIAICPKCLPLSLVKPKSETEMKLIMYKILKIGSQIGRCFLKNGRIMVWCEQRRNFACMAPQQIQLGKSNEKSKVFVSGIALLNFLACVYDEKTIPNSKKQEKKKKSQTKSQTQKIISSSAAHNNNTNQISNNDSGIFQYTAHNLPQQIKLFFQPKDEKQYFLQLETLPSKLPMTKFWTSISQGMRQLILNMLSVDATKRVDLDTILGIPYFQSSVQMKMYFILADGLEGMEIKEKFAFMKALEVVIRQGTVFQQQILDEYIVPLLIQIATPPHNSIPNSLPPQLLAPFAVSILLELTIPPLQTIFLAFKKCQPTDKRMILLALQKKQKLFYLFDQQRFDSLISRMIFCCYEIDDLLDIAVGSTQFVMESLKQEKYKKEIQFKLVTKVLSKQFDKEKDKHQQQIFINALKCTIQLVMNNTVTSIKSFTDLHFNALAYNLQANIHILYLYKLFIQKLHPKTLWSTMMTKLQPYMSQPQISDELFTTAHKLSKTVLDKMYQQRKISSEDNIQLDYAAEYFKSKDKLSKENLSLEDQIKKVKMDIQKNFYTSILWIAKQILI